MNDNFILMTITGETCAGKSYLLDELVRRGIVNKIISCTTRPIRTNEVEGKDYYFVNKNDFQWELDRNNLIEFVKFNDAWYGTTNKEFQNKIDGKKPGVIIIEPNGIKIYEKICKEQNIRMLKIFVNTPEKVRLDRLNKRFLKELESSTEDKFKLIERFSKRVRAIEEYTWKSAYDYDLYVSGEYIEPSIMLIKEVIKNF